jgi:hypothetical protein
MKPKIIKIHYPSRDADEIGELSAGIRDIIMDSIPSNQMSFSFSSNKESGYIMVYPTAPLLSIRISNHDDKGQTDAACLNPTPENLIIKTKNTTIINAEADGGQMTAQKEVVDAIMSLVATSAEIKAMLREKINHEI